MGVEVPIHVFENDYRPWHAHGCSLYGKAAITVPSLYFGERVNNDQHTAILAHEVAHIKHNDAAWFGLLVVTSVVAFSILGSVLTPFVPFIVKNILINGCILYVMHFRSVSQENRADDEALQFLNTKQKRAFIRFLEGVRDKNIALRNSINTETWYGKILNGLIRLQINSKGENLQARITHPTLESRIAKIQKSIQEEPSVVWSWLPWKWKVSRAA